MGQSITGPRCALGPRYGPRRGPSTAPPHCGATVELPAGATFSMTVIGKDPVFF
jgi:hypothetical protein